MTWRPTTGAPKIEVSWKSGADKWTSPYLQLSVRSEMAERSDEQIDALARYLTEFGFAVDIDGDGRHVEILGFASAQVFFELRYPNRLIWDHELADVILHVDDSDPLESSKIREDILKILYT